MPLPVITTVPQRIQDQWLFTDAELEATPAILHGLSVAEERARRAKGVNFITQAGIMLKLPQVTLGTASMFLHRIFMRIGMDEKVGGIHHYNIAATALFLATKSEENCRKTKDIVIAVAKVAGKDPSLVIDEQSKEFWRWKDNILLYEEMMLELLTFDVVLDSPYTHLYHLLRRLNLEELKQLRNVAWAFVNDSQLTTLGLMMPARDVAIGAVFFAAKYTGNVVDDAEDGRAWWKIAEGDEQKIIRAVTVLHDFYTDNPLKKSDSPHEGSPPKSPADLNATRRRRSGGSPNGESMRGEDTDMDSVTDGIRHKKEKSDESRENETTNRGATNSHRKENSDELKNSGESQIQQHNKAPSDESRHAPARVGEEGAREVRGDSDAALKEAANDPATHQQKNASASSSVASGVGDLHIAQQASGTNGSTIDGGELDEGEVREDTPREDGLKVPAPALQNGETANGGDGGVRGNLSVKRKAEDDVDMEQEEKRPKTGGSEEGELE